MWSNIDVNAHEKPSNIGRDGFMRFANWRPLSRMSAEQQGNAENGRVAHGALARDRQGRQQHQAGDGGDGLPHPFPRLQQEQPGGEKQPGAYVHADACDGRMALPLQ